jgi:hypothetical protein
VVVTGAKDSGIEIGNIECRTLPAGFLRGASRGRKVHAEGFAFFNFAAMMRVYSRTLR